MLDRPGDEEEGALVARMGDQVDQAGGYRLWRADAEQQHQDT